MRKFIKDTFKKTTFVFYNEIHEKIDGISMVSVVALVLATIIMPGLESTIIKKVFNTGKLLTLRR